MHPCPLLPWRAFYQWGTIHYHPTLQSKGTRRGTIWADLTAFHTRIKSHPILGMEEGNSVRCMWPLLHLYSVVGLVLLVELIGLFVPVYIVVVGQHQDSGRCLLGRLLGQFVSSHWQSEVFTLQNLSSHTHISLFSTAGIRIFSNLPSRGWYDLNFRVILL